MWHLVTMKWNPFRETYEFYSFELESYILVLFWTFSLKDCFTKTLKSNGFDQRLIEPKHSFIELVEYNMSIL
jgi:hypothetical protein